MCEPVTLSIATGIAVAGAAASAYSAYQQGKYARDMGIRQQHNAEIAASRTEGAGASAAAKIKGQASDVIGSQRVAAGASGIDPGSGVALKREGDTAIKSELDVETVKNNAAMNAWGIRVGGTEARAQGDASMIAGEWSAAGHGLEGVGSALGGLGKWQRWRKTGSAW